MISKTTSTKTMRNHRAFACTVLGSSPRVRCIVIDFSFAAFKTPRAVVASRARSHTSTRVDARRRHRPRRAMTTVPEASSPRPGDALDALRAQLTCPLCRDVFTDPTTLPCNHTHCFECVARALGGKSWDASACPECAAPTVMKDLSVNMTLKSFVENFKSVDAELREALGAMRALGGTEAMDCDGDGGDDVGASDRGGSPADGGVMQGDDAREREAKACEKLAETIRAIDATLAVIDEKLAVYKAKDKALESQTQPRTQTQPGTQGTLDIESMTLSELRRLHRNVLGRSAASTRKKPWFVKELSQYDRDVMAAAMAATQPESPKVVVAYSSSALRCGGSQDEKFAEVERIIKSIDAGAVFMGMKDLTSECTHLIMDTGSKDRVVKKRTVKYVDAIARGLYVVHEDWLADCAERGSFCERRGVRIKRRYGYGLRWRIASLRGRSSPRASVPRDESKTALRRHSRARPMLRRRAPRVGVGEHLKARGCHHRARVAENAA